MRKKSRKILLEEIERLNEQLRKAYVRIDFYRDQVVKLPKVPTKQQLENQLAGINYKEKYPLSHAIKNNGVSFVEFYVLGKSIGKYTNKGAVEFSKKYIKQTDWVEIGKWGIRDSAYEVKKIRKERE